MLRSLLGVLLVSACAHAGPLAAHVIDIGDIDGDSLGPVQAKFDERLAAGDKKITFRITSYGGEVDAGMDFIRHVEDAKKESGAQVQCVVDERAMSMAFIILQSPVCDERYMTRRSVLLAHRVSAQVKGTAEGIRSALRRMEASDKALAEIAAAWLKVTREEYDFRTAHGDWTMAADEALAVGAVDGFVAPEAIPSPYKLAEPGGPLAALKKLLGSP